MWVENSFHSLLHQPEQSNLSSMIDRISSKGDYIHWGHSCTFWWEEQGQSSEHSKLEANAYVYSILC